MKRFSDAIEDFVASQASLRDAARRRQHRSPPRHYHHTQRQQARIDMTAPKLAVLYPTLDDASDSVIPSCPHSYIAEQLSTFPTAFPPTMKMLIVDTGASISISPDKSDFVGDITLVQPTTLQGIAAGLRVHGIGTAVYSFQADDGAVVTVTLPHTLYVPGCTMRLLCTRHLAASTMVCSDGFTVHSTEAVLICHGHRIRVAYHDASKLPIVFTTKLFMPFPESIGPTTAPVHPPALSAHSAILPQTHAATTQINLTKKQQLKLLLHERCNHRSMSVINQWIRDGSLGVDPALASTPDPTCAACQLGKAHHRSHKLFTGSITSRCTFLGAGVSADQLEAGCPGKIPTTKGLPTTKQ
jgi:hypothetical protein